VWSKYLLEENNFLVNFLASVNHCKKIKIFIISRSFAFGFYVQGINVSLLCNANSKTTKSFYFKFSSHCRCVYLHELSEE